MSIILVLLCLGLAVTAGLWEKNIFNPATLFFGFWALISGLSALRLYNLFPVSDRAYWFIILGLLSFFAGYVVVKLVKPVKKQRENPSECLEISERFEFNYKVLFILYAALIAYLAFGASKVLLAMLQGVSMHDIRLNFFEQESSIFSFIQVYFVEIGIYIALAISMINFLMGRYKKLLLIMTGAIIVLFAIQNGGRLVFYRFAVDVIVTCLIFMGLSRKYQRSIRRMGHLLAGILIVAFVGVVAITALRSSSLQSFYVYFAGSINLFDNRLAAIDMANHATHGYASMAGVVKPFFTLTDNLGILNFPESYLKAYGIVRIHVKPYYHISPDIIYNAYVSPFLYFYLDFRIPGIIAGSALYGAICSWAYKNMLRKADIKSIAIYVLIAEELFTTMIRWQFTVQSYTIAVALLLLGIGIFKKAAPKPGVEPETKQAP